MIALAALVIVADLANSRTTIINNEYFKLCVDAETADGTRHSTISTIAPSS